MNSYSLIFLNPIVIVIMFLYWMIHVIGNYFNNYIYILSHDDLHTLDIVGQFDVVIPNDKNNFYRYKGYPVNISFDGFLYVSVDSRICFLTNSGRFNSISVDLQLGLPQIFTCMKFEHLKLVHNKVYVDIDDCISLPPHCDSKIHITSGIHNAGKILSKMDENQYTNYVYYDDLILMHSNELLHTLKDNELHRIIRLHNDEELVLI
jgi:hypothetical protein